MQDIYPKNLGKIIGYCYWNRNRCWKTALKKVVHKTAKATGEFLGNKITQNNLKTAENSRYAEEIIILAENIQEILNELRKVLWNGKL